VCSKQVSNQLKEMRMQVDKVSSKVECLSRADVSSPDVGVVVKVDGDAVSVMPVSIPLAEGGGHAGGLPPAKSAKQAKIQEKEAAKQAKIQEKEAAKQAKIQEKEAAKQAKIQEKEAAKQAKIQE
jgi:hypothetical protein